MRHSLFAQSCLVASESWYFDSLIERSFVDGLVVA